jgi:hypothetical protein
MARMVVSMERHGQEVKRAVRIMEDGGSKWVARNEVEG